MNPLLAPLSRLGAGAAARRQKASALWNPAHWGAGVDATGRLTLDGVSLACLVEARSDPVLAVSRQKLLDDAARFIAAVQTSFPDALVAFSYKTNCVPGVLQELHAAGMGAEVISPYELWLAAKLGTPGELIVVNGVNKGRAFLEDAARLGVAAINVDHGDELESLAAIAVARRLRIRVGLRLRVDRSSHFGLGLESGEAYAAASTIAAHPELFDFTGLHFHALADDNDAGPRIRYLHRALDFARDLERGLGLTVRTLNIGGGYGVPTVKVMSRYEYARQRLLDLPASPPEPESRTDVARCFARLSDALHAECRRRELIPPRFVVEPGRAVTSQSHVLLTKVHSVKANAAGPEFAMTDAGKILAAYPCDYEYHHIFLANRMDARPERNYHLMGRLCTSADWLAKNRCLPKLQRGDVLAVMDAGAYFTSYASNFAFARPEVVMLDRGKTRTLRHGETFEHMTGMDTTDQLHRGERPKHRLPSVAGA